MSENYTRYFLPATLDDWVLKFQELIRLIFVLLFRLGRLQRDKYIHYDDEYSISVFEIGGRQGGKKTNKIPMVMWVPD